MLKARKMEGYQCPFRATFIKINNTRRTLGIPEDNTEADVI